VEDGVDDQHRINAFLDIAGVHFGTDQQPPGWVTIRCLRRPLILVAASPGDGPPPRQRR
jgi:hypothetical protein